MKKTIITLILTLMTSSVFAYSCPALWAELDYEIKLAKESGMSEEKNNLRQDVSEVMTTTYLLLLLDSFCLVVVGLLL